MFLTIKLCTHAELFEIEQNIFINIILAVNNPERLICHKTKPINQVYNPNIKPNRRGLSNTLTASLQQCKTPSASV